MPVGGGDAARHGIGFNPRPAVRPGDAHRDYAATATYAPFQSAPGREAGRCIKLRSAALQGVGFNPRPAVRPGDARSKWLTTLVLAVFQSAPGREAGRCRPSSPAP